MRRHSAEEIRALREKVRPRFERYTREVLLPRFPEAGEPCLTAPEHGLGSLLFFVEAKGLPPLVLRAESGRRLRRRAKGHDALLALGLNVPRVLHRDVGPVTRLRYGHCFMAEERLAGEPLRGDCGPDVAAGLGHSFARLHANVGPGAGHVAALHWPKRRMRTKLRRWTQKRLHRFAAKGGPHAAEIIRWVEAQPEALWEHAARLSSGDLSASNVLVSDGRVGLIDLSGVCYASAPQEVVRTRHKILGGDDALFAAFLAAYREAATRDLRDEVDRALPLFELLHHVRAYVSSRGRASEAEAERMSQAFAAAAAR